MPFKLYVKSLTFDQGIEFSQFEWIRSCLEADIYFCEPASPYQKGSIENRNGVLRTIYKRTCDIIAVSQRQINREVANINARPMLCLDYKSPEQLFNQFVYASN